MSDELQLGSVSTDNDNIYLDAFREGNLFLIDASKQMFNNTSYSKTYFSQCLEAYKRIVIEKCSWNCKDSIGLILFGTNEWDKDPEVPHVLTLQKFNQVSIDLATDIQAITTNEDRFKKIASEEYPLHDALWQAAQIFSNVKTTMPLKSVILITCNDNPFITDINEQRRVENRVQSFKSLGIRLRVLGLGDKWKDDLFYKYLSSLASDCGAPNKLMRLEDLEHELKFPASIMANLKWHLSPSLSFTTVIYNVSTKIKYPDKVYVSKENNEPLMSMTHLVKNRGFEEVEDSEHEENEESDDDIVLDRDIRYYKKYAGKDICFTVSEHRSISRLYNPGIHLIKFQPFECDPLYFTERVKFLTVPKKSSKDEKALFKGLVMKCAAKGVMPVCSVVMRKRSPRQIRVLIPNVKDGGFYMYKMPYKDTIRDLREPLQSFVFNDDNKPCPIDEDALSLMKNLMEMYKVDFDYTNFQNPKLYKMLAHIKALAMDDELGIIKPDSTKPQFIKQENIEEIKQLLDEILNLKETAVTFGKRKKPQMAGPNKTRKVDIPDFQQLAARKEVGTCTVHQLKDFLKSNGKMTTGVKADLVARVYEYFDSV